MRRLLKLCTWATAVVACWAMKLPRMPGRRAHRRVGSWVGTRGFEQGDPAPWWVRASTKPGAQQVGQLVLVRHGVTQWDRTQTFTGWADPDIDECGALEARSAALALKESGFVFDLAYTSVLKRSVHTTWLLLKELGQVALPLYKSWRLNERSYGSLTGLSVDESIAEHGAEVVSSWRRSLDARPPPYEADHPFHPAADLKCARRLSAAGARGRHLFSHLVMSGGTATPRTPSGHRTRPCVPARQVPQVAGPQRRGRAHRAARERVDAGGDPARAARVVRRYI